MFYEKTQKLLELSLWMQNADAGVSIADIMQKFGGLFMFQDPQAAAQACLCLLSRYPKVPFRSP